MTSSVGSEGALLKLKEYRLILGSAAISAFIFYAFRFSEDVFYHVYIAQKYLIFHTMIEFASVVMYVAAFLLVYYVGENDNRLRMKITATTLLFTGLVDFWHTFYYNGMPGILVESSVQAATAFWIVGRLGFAMGIFAASVTTLRHVVKGSVRLPMTLAPLFLSLFFLVYISFFPQFFPPMFVEGQGLTLTKQILEYLVIAILVVSLIVLLKEYKVAKRRSLALLIAALIISIFSELSFTSYASVYDTYNLLGHLYKLVASYLIFKVLFIFNISYPYGELNKAKKEISEYANNLESLVQKRTLEVEKATGELLKDLEYARNIQKAIMPDREMSFDVLNFYSAYVPYEKIGGDFFGVEDLNEDYIAFHIGDVAGHGIPAAMMTIFMKQTIGGKRLYPGGSQDVLLPDAVLHNLYLEYNDSDFPYEMYAVLLYGLVHKKTREIVFSSAGLNTLPAVIHRDGGVSFVEHQGFPICKFGKDFEPGFTNFTLSLRSGDKMFFYTDGLVDAKNQDGELFGTERLHRLLTRTAKKEPARIVEEILATFEEFVVASPRMDDVHFFVMEIK